jgi:Ca2+/Na+ antiporter
MTGQVLAMLVLVFFTTALLSSVFLSLTVAFACAASIPPRTMAFTLLAIGAEAPDCIVNFIASK